MRQLNTAMPNPEKTFIAVLPGHVTADYTGGYVMEARGAKIPTDPEAWELVMRSHTRDQLKDTEKLVLIDDARFEVFEVVPGIDDEPLPGHLIFGFPPVNP